MKSKTFYLTKSRVGEVELWKSKPVNDKGLWFPSNDNEYGSEVVDNFLDDLVGEGQCVKVELSVKKIVKPMYEK